MISLRGADFVPGPGLSVTIGGVEASEVRLISPNEITALAPGQPGVAGPVEVTVKNPSGRSASGRLLTYYPVDFDLADAPSLPAGVGPVRSLGTADFNGDGQLDLAVTNGIARSSTGSTVSVLLGRSDDFDGDARPDLAASNYFDLTLLPNISR